MYVLRINAANCSLELSCFILERPQVLLFHSSANVLTKTVDDLLPKDFHRRNRFELHGIRVLTPLNASTSSQTPWSSILTSSSSSSDVCVHRHVELAALYPSAKKQGISSSIGSVVVPADGKPESKHERFRVGFRVCATLLVNDFEFKLGKVQMPAN